MGRGLVFDGEVSPESYPKNYDWKGAFFDALFPPAGGGPGASIVILDPEKVRGLCKYAEELEQQVNELVVALDMESTRARKAEGMLQSTKGRSSRG